MNCFKLTNLEISQAVDRVIVSKEWSVRDCCSEFNLKYEVQIENHEIKKMSKDFVQRVRSNNFTVVNQRIVLLCKFLEIDIHTKKRALKKRKFEKEFNILEEVVRNDPSSERRLKSLLAILTTLFIRGQENTREVGTN